MKEKDLEKNLDNLIIDGLIKEAEQDNADFEAAMRKLSDEEFEELIYVPAYALAESDSYEGSQIQEEKLRPNIVLNRAQRIQLNDVEMDKSVEKAERKSKWKVFRPWITSTVAAAAVVLIVLIPSINVMNGKLCESALYASTEYISSSRSASEVNGLSDDKLKAKLPELEKRYRECIKEDGKFTYYTDDLKEAGWDLTLAYLRLHKKGNAEKILKVLSGQYSGTPFGDHCQKMLNQL